MTNFIFPYKRALLIEKKRNISVSINKNQFILKSIKDDSIFIVCEIESKPSLNMEQEAVAFGHYVRYVSRPARWENIKISTNDSEENSIKFCQWFMEDIVVRQVDYATHKKDLELFTFDDYGVQIEKWNLHGCVPVSADFSNSAIYNDNGFVKAHSHIDIEISFDRATLLH
jgi:hypothetical protein